MGKKNVIGILLLDKKARFFLFITFFNSLLVIIDKNHSSKRKLLT